VLPSLCMFHDSFCISFFLFFIFPCSLFLYFMHSLFFRLRSSFCLFLCSLFSRKRFISYLDLRIKSRTNNLLFFLGFHDYPPPFRMKYQIEDSYNLWLLPYTF
jgi:hypothetical protein